MRARTVVAGCSMVLEMPRERACRKRAAARHEQHGRKLGLKGGHAGWAFVAGLRAGLAAGLVDQSSGPGPQLG